ncbi:molybdenum cofactor biosynthesis protein MoaE [Betaproteobacteria bacterium]|nr:molybdenum cofactor biosynthesis protein MoaE [Betaproteobacteria bacterium]
MSPLNNSILVKVQKEQIAVGSLIEQLMNLSERESEVGAISTFTGRVRGKEETRKVNELFLEHYPTMTEKKIMEIVCNASQKFSINGCIVIHRIGKLVPGELIVFVGVTSRHRKDAFEACSYVMDFLKTEAPFWKKEKGSRGEKWINSRDTDYLARDTWLGK